MELNQKVITRLETMFAKECQIAIDTLAYHSMPEEQFTDFENSLNTFFKYDDLKDFISGSLISKTKEIVRRFQNDHPEKMLSFRRLGRLIAKFGDEDSLGVFTSFLLTDKLPFHFFILLEEMGAKNIDTLQYQKIFESLITVHQYDLKIINQYLSIIRQDGFGLTKNLLKNSHYASLVKYIRELSGTTDRQKILGEQIVPSVIENFTGDRTHYMGIVMSVAEGGTDFLKDLLHNCEHIGECEEKFGRYLTSNHAHNILLIKNFMSYLEHNNEKLISSIEDAFLKDTRAELILQYAIQIPVSNKRKVLIRMVELKNEKYLVEFIKKFPAYKSLMPML